MILDLLVFLLILSVLVLIHEAGHFFVAKKFGIKVEEFGYGLPPRAWGKKIGETIYSINWLPIGGFVKLYGEDDAGGGSIAGKHDHTNVKEKSRAFFARSVSQRALVVAAGVIMNVVLAVVIYYLFMGISGFKTELPLIGEHKFFAVNQTDKSEIIISDVFKDSPAEQAGVRPMSKVVSLNGKSVTVDEFPDVIAANKGKQITLTWQDVRTNEQDTVTLTPRTDPPKNQGALGVSFFPIRTAQLSYDTPVQRLFSGIIHPVNLMAYNVAIMSKLVQVSIEEKTTAPLSDGVSGPVGIFSLVGTILNITDVKERILQILNLAGLLSISLAFFNVLPIPALDGGRLFFILIEGITRRKVSPKFEAYAHQIGMAVLISLILLITFKDVLQLFK
jgi:regulator of sigma E protease